MTNYFIPSLLIPELFYPVKRDKYLASEVIGKMMEQEVFYKSIELGDGFGKEERQRILKLTSENDLEVTQWLTFLLQENNLDVASLDKDLRMETVKQIKDNLHMAAEIGAKNIAIVTGDNPIEEKRADGMQSLYESLCEIAEACSEYDMNILVEPLDTFADKKRILGTTEETVDLLSRVNKEYDNIGIAFDTAHAALNDEDILVALEKGKSFIHQIHFSNAVLDPNSHLYGDKHMAIGEPGFLTENEITTILQKAKELGIRKEQGLRVACEVRGEKNKENSYKNELNLRGILKRSLNNVSKK